MQHKDNNIYSLINKFLKGEADSLEKKQVEDWYHSFNDSDVEISTADRNFREELEKRMKLKLLASIQVKEEAPVIPINSFNRKRIAVAAALVILLGISLYTFLLQNDKVPAAQTAIVDLPVAADIAVIPGGNKATLTLADGSVIYLDSSDNGRLSTQANVSVQKNANGQISYIVKPGNTTTASPLYNTISTPRGGQYNVTLSDGTMVWLNSASSIHFPVAFTGNKREITITGEAYFEVAKDEQKPFIVTAGNNVVTVMGTHFNINAYTDEAAINTTLLEGKVKVSTTANNQNFRILAPGQQAQGTPSGALRITNSADLEQVMAWKNGLFIYKSTPLKTILREISRWYDVEIIYHNTTPMSFTGQLTRQDQIKDVLNKLELTGKVNLQLKERKIIVTPK